MKDVDAMSTEQLVAAYVALCLDEDDATLRSQMGRANRAVRQRMKIESVLRARGMHERCALIPLLKHPSAQVRLNSAKDLLAVVPAEARATLEELAAHGPGDQRGSAGMCLALLDDGTFKPT